MIVPTLAITMRHLAIGESYFSLQFTFKMQILTINCFVPEVCDAKSRYDRDKVIACRTCPEDWLDIEQGQYSRTWISKDQIKFEQKLSTFDQIFGSTMIGIHETFDLIF